MTDLPSANQSYEMPDGLESLQQSGIRSAAETPDGMRFNGPVEQTRSSPANQPAMIWFLQVDIRLLKQCTKHPQGSSLQESDISRRYNAIKSCKAAIFSRRRA